MAARAAGAGGLGLAAALAAAATLGPGEEERRRRELAPGAVRRLAPDVRRARAEAAAAFRAGGFGAWLRGELASNQAGETGAVRAMAVESNQMRRRRNAG